MQKVLKQVVGIDVAQEELVVQLGRIYDDLTTELYATKSFGNSKGGFKALLLWVKQRTDAGVEVRYVMEATGVYHERLAYYLHDEGAGLSIVLPSKVSHYQRSLSTKTQTDYTAAKAIALFGLERKLTLWSKPRAIFKQLRNLSRERRQLVQETTVAKNQLHAEQAAADAHPKTLDRIGARIGFISAQNQEVMEELDNSIACDTQVKAAVELLCSIPGIGVLTAATILGETLGFELIDNKRQLASYAGLDVQEKQSGTSVKGKPRISKKGNRYLRAAMHFPALTAIRHDEHYKAIFDRLVSKHGVKMKAATAVQRRLLEMSFTVFKKQQPYDKNYCRQSVEVQ